VRKKPKIDPENKEKEKQATQQESENPKMGAKHHQKGKEHQKTLGVLFEAGTSNKDQRRLRPF